jgi:hypothetical protein
MGDNTEMGTLAVNEELHAKQQEAARAAPIDKALARLVSLKEYKRVASSWFISGRLFPA